MPNWAFNELTVSGSSTEVERFRNNVETINSVFAMQAIVPCPNELTCVSAGSNGDIGYAVYFADNWEKIAGYTWVKEKLTEFDLLDVEHFRKAFRENIDKNDYYYNDGKRYSDNFQKYGSPTWYEWCIKHWGTKWDVQDPVRVDEGSCKIYYRFDTAWGGAWAFYKKASELYPTLKFEVRVVADGEMIFDEDGEDITNYDVVGESAIFVNGREV